MKAIKTEKFDKLSSKKDEFWGREYEINRLKRLQSKHTSSLVVIYGRRRIGKSALVNYFAKHNATNFYEFQGLAPQPRQTDRDQLSHFANQLERQTGLKGFSFSDWNDAFNMLSDKVSKGRTVIMLDEISWMGAYDLNFAGKLKTVWDTVFARRKDLIFVICGSVSTWIEENVLKNRDFVGRISLEINLKELPLNVIRNFWRNKKKLISSKEILNALLVTGGVPKYLEEITTSDNILIDLLHSCFSEAGFFFNEYEKIFNEIFNKRSNYFRRIVEIIVQNKFSAAQIAKKLKVVQSGELAYCLNALELAGFIERDYIYSGEEKNPRSSRYRIRDNYLRFYLKYILPIRDKIKKLGKDIKSIDKLVDWDIISGFQFENLVLNNLSLIIDKLGISSADILSASPYFQRKNKSNKGGCQIDLLIQAKFNTYYICEIKFSNELDTNVIKEVERKLSVLQRKKNVSVRPVLIYAGEVKDSVMNRYVQFFDKLIDVEELLG